MSNLVLSSNVQSPLLAGLVQTAQEDISYGIQPSFPLMAKKIETISARNAVTAPFASKEVVFDITRQSFLRDLQVRNLFRSGPTAIASTHPLGLTVFGEANLRSANKVICSMSDSYIIGRTQSSSVAKCSAIYRRAFPLSTATGLPTSTTTADLECYTPIFTPFTENDPRNFYNLRQYESLQLACRYNTPENMGIAAGSAFLTCVSTLFVSSVEYDDKTYKMLLAENSPPDRPTQFLGYSSIKEIVPCTATVNNFIKINSQQPAFTTYVYLRDGTSAVQGALLNITSISIKVNGVSLFESIPKLVMSYEEDQNFGACGTYSNGTTTVQSLPNKVVAIHWGLDPSRTFCSGAFALVGTNDVKIYVTSDVPTTTADSLIYVNEYWQMVSFDNVTSSVSVLTSS